MKPLVAGTETFPAWRARLSILILLSCIATGVWRIVLTYPILFQTIDEPYHICVGLDWLARDRVRLDQDARLGGEILNPPLANMAAGFLPYIHGLRPLNKFVSPGNEGDAILHSHNDFPRNLARAREGILPFFVLGTVVVWLWARHIAGDFAAAAAAVLFSTLPPMLAHAGLATMDMAVSAAIVGTFYAFARWLEVPRLPASALLGAGAGLAVLSKFSSLLFLPACATALLAAALLSNRHSWVAIRRELSLRWRGGVLALFVAFLVIWAGYQFQMGSLTSREARPHRVLAPVKKFLERHEHIRDAVYAVVETPIPAPNLIRGIGQLREKHNKAQLTYFLGEFSDNGWWYFFPVLLAVKTPIAFLVLLAPGLINLWRGGRLQYRWQRLAPALCAATILVVSSPVRINTGVRHVLPIFAFLSIVAGVGLVELLARVRMGRIAFVGGIVLFLWQIVGSVRAHPDYLASFNELALGHPERIVVDSDLDWGQDLWRLRDRLKELGVTRVTLGYWWGRWEGQGLPLVQPLVPYQPTSGWVAITEYTLRTLGERFRRQAGARTGAFEWLESYPYERVGTSIRLYHIPEKS